jgi:hypothetical protein
MRVAVRRHLQREALVQRPTGDPVQVVARHLQDRDPGLGRQRDGLGDPIVGGHPGGDVQRRRRDACPEALHDRVPAEHGLRPLAVTAPACDRTAPLLLLLLSGAAVGRLLLRVPGTQVSGRGRSLAAQGAPDLAAGTDDHPLLRTVLADGTTPLGISSHRYRAS